MNTRHVLAATLSAAVFFGVGGTSAFAADATGPDTVACATATTKVEFASRAAVLAAKKLNDAQEQIDAALQIKVDAASAALKKALDDATKANPNTDAIVAAQANLQAVLKLVQDKAAPSELTDALIKAKANLQAALDVKVRDCGSSTRPTTAPTTAPTSAPVTITVEPNKPFANCDDVVAAGKAPIMSTDPRFQKSLDSDNDGVGCELNGDDDSDDSVVVVPGDAPETGDGSTE